MSLPPAPPLRVVLADDDPVLRALLAGVLGAHDRLEVVQAYPDAASLVRGARADRPDAVVLDNQMPGGDGVEALPALLREVPGARVVVYSSDTAVRGTAVDRGAHAFVPKGDLDRLLEAVLVAARHDSVVTHLVQTASGG